MRYQIEVDGKLVTVYAQKLRGETWVHIGGRSVKLPKTEKSFGKKGSAGTSDPGALIAPMPGKVTKILKRAGDQVKVGDVVLVMEAMKMEYTLKSAADGVIEAISAEVNQQVTLGKKLASVKVLS